MSHYFFDYQGHGAPQRDEIGCQARTFEDARRGAIELLTNATRDSLPDGEDARFQVTVRDAVGNTAYQASLTFHGKRFGQ